MKIILLIAAGAALSGASTVTAQPKVQDGLAPAVAPQPLRGPFVAPAPIRQIVDRQLGTRYGATDKEAVARCVTAALAQGAILYGVNGYAGTDGYAAYEG